MLNDHELLLKYATARSQEAFTELVRRHLQLVYSAALRRVSGDTHLAEDVTQVVFAALARKAENIARQQPMLTGWLYTSTKYAAIDALRRAHRWHARAVEAQLMNEIQPDAAEIDWERCRPIIDHALDTLGDADRGAVLLRCFKGRPYSEVGAELGLSEEAARKRVDRALDRLRTALVKRGVTSTSAALAVTLNNHAMTTVPAGLLAAVSGMAMLGTTSGIVGPAGLLSYVTAKFGAATAAAVIIGGAAAIGTAGLAPVIWQQRQDLAMWGKFAEEQDARRVHVREQMRDLEAAGRNLINARRELLVARAWMAESAAPAPTGPDESRMSRIQSLVGSSPEYAPFRTENRRLNVQRFFGDLFDDLKLPREKLERFKQLLMARYEAREAVEPSFLAKGLDPSSDTAGEEWRAAGEKLDPAIRELLGKQIFNEFRDYDIIVTRYMHVIDNFATDLAEAGLPLTAKTRRALARALFDADDNRYGTGRIGVAPSQNPVDPCDGLNGFERNFVERAVRLLTTPQLAALPQFLRDRRGSEEIFYRVAALTAGGNGRGE